MRLELDGVSILLDGLCSPAEPYLGTPEELYKVLLKEPVHLLAFTHGHQDHFSAALVSTYRKQTLRPILGPENLPYVTDISAMSVGGVKITPVPSRHIGKVEKGLQHVSFIIEGSKCVWFLGDASPLQWQGREDLPRPDVLIAPYAYGLSESAWRFTCGLTKELVMLHLPKRENDPYGLWPMVDTVTGKSCPIGLHIPELGESVSI